MLNTYLNYLNEDKSLVSKVKQISTISDMKSLLKFSKSSKDFKPGMIIRVNDKMQTNYTYELSELPGKNLKFKPHFTPKQMLEHGVFEGKYLNDCILEFPREWYERALKLGKLSPERPNPNLNEFKIKSRDPLKDWRSKGWIIGDDVRGWFQWYCRYFLGRRDSIVDNKQIKRWQAFKRHRSQVVKNCKRGDFSCRPKQRQALLQWAWNPYV